MQINSKFPRDVFNELKYRGHDLSKVKFYYVNRGSPNDIAEAEGSRILTIERGFLKLHSIPFETMIPYHRIKLITYNGEKIFER